MGIKLDRAKHKRVQARRLRDMQTHIGTRGYSKLYYECQSLVIALHRKEGVGYHDYKTTINRIRGWLYKLGCDIHHAQAFIAKIWVTKSEVQSWR